MRRRVERAILATLREVEAQLTEITDPQLRRVVALRLLQAANAQG